MTLFSAKPETVNRLTNPNGEMINGSRYTGTIVAMSADNAFNRDVAKVRTNCWFSINYIGEQGFSQCREANSEVRWYISENEYHKYGIDDGSFVQKTKYL